MIDWLRMMYRKMSYVVKLGPHHSEAFQSMVGILAGDSSSQPGLWNVYFSDFFVPPHGDGISLGGQRRVEQADDIILFSTLREGLQAKLDSLLRVHSLLFSPCSLSVTRSPCVSKHKYVGVTLSSTDRSIFCSPTHYYIKASKARKSMNALFGAEKFVGTIPPKEGISIYMATVDPHLMSACDVSINKTFIRRLLGIAKRSPTGMWPVKYRRLMLTLCYWRDHFLAHAVKDATDLAMVAKPSWISDLVNALHFSPHPVSLDLSRQWSPADIDNIIEAVRQSCCNDINDFLTSSPKALPLHHCAPEPRNSRSDGMRKSTLSTLRSYLAVLVPAHRKVLVRLLTSSHALAVEGPRTPKPERACRFRTRREG
ncbi:hypothetical protein ARMGADRAFT_1048816 [Armillaria gallica]|uniref:Reverse transcriptase domain-containing protein n=1 Tax=Armillaria gallica TaxID=47427 RepID=A0A2H3CED2_ARMGA|nr:hypothetical protein ARMGADRAFT_1048816 [Armillaria gallica]